MHDPDDKEPRAQTTAAEDESDQQAVLALLIAEHPTLLTVADLIREIAADKADFMETDRVERAVRDLGGVGLIHREGETVRPTRAALRFDQLFLNND
jgi:predicted transcriptional regulator